MSAMQSAGMFVGILALVGAILGVVFAAIARAMTQEAERVIAAEGLVLRSAGRPITTTLRDFRSARRRASHRVSRNSGHVVLTSRGLHVITRPRFFFAPQDLAHCTVRDEGGRLRLSTSHPPEATGTVELRFAVDDAAAWIAALRERGVQLG